MQASHQVQQGSGQPADGQQAGDPQAGDQQAGDPQAGHPQAGDQRQDQRAGAESGGERGLSSEEAAEAIWRRFHRRLLNVAARSLPDYVRRDEDEEDVVNVAFHSFFRRLHQGSFPQLNDRNELWKVLSSITRRKATNLIRNKNRQKRASARNSETDSMDAIVGGAPSPELVAIHRETVEKMLGMLDESLQEIAFCRLNGYSNQEIAAQIRRSVPTVERRLRLIRQKWEGLDV